MFPKVADFVCMNLIKKKLFLFTRWKLDFIQFKFFLFTKCNHELFNVNWNFSGLRNQNWNFSSFHSINQKNFELCVLNNVSRKHFGFHLIWNYPRIPLNGTNFQIIPFPK